MSVFYKIDSTKVTYEEYRWGNSPVNAAFGWLLSKCGVKFPSSTDDPNVESLAPFEAHETAIPSEVQEMFQPVAQELALLGFHSPRLHVIRDASNSTLICWATFPHVSGQAFARIHYRSWTHPRPPRVYLWPIFYSAFTDGTFLNSTAGKPDLAAPPAVRVNRLRGVSATALWQSHWERLQAEARAGRAVVTAMTADEVRALSERVHVEHRDFHLRRGVFKPVSGAEQQQATAYEQSVAAATQAGGGEHAEVLAEMDRLQNKKPGLGSGAALLLLTMAAFVVFGGMVWGWKFALLLIPILLIHEFGHYVAMRLFKYRNLRMLFIPLFGAAVIGSNYNVPGWKKVIVSLMGPVPGIFLGCVLGGVALFTKNDLLLTTAMMFVVINAFNLLPVLPLDGGWVLHTILFCRNASLDAGFRIVAGLGLIATGLFFQARILPFLAIPMFLGVPTVFKLASIVGKLRAQGIEPASEDSQTIPPAVAQTIIGEVKSAFPRGVNNKILAQHTLSVFETLNARPPHWAVSLLFLGIHGATVLVAVVAMMILAMGKSGDVGSFLRTAAQAPRHEIDCGSLKVWRGATATASLTNSRHTIIATLPKRKTAEAKYKELSLRVPDPARLTLFGDSLLLTLPAGDDALRQKWVAEFESFSRELVVERTNFSVGLRLQFIAPTDEEAKSIEEELKGYFQSRRDLRLIPPWQPGRALTAQESKARRTYRTAALAASGAYTNAAFVALNQRITAAQRQGDDAKEKRLREEIGELFKSLRQQALADLKRPDAANYDPAILEQFTALPEHSSTNEEYPKHLLKLGASMGQWPEADAAPDPDRCAASSGIARRFGPLLTLEWVNFHSIAEGAPALLEWLCAKRCGGFNYDIPNAASPALELSEEQ